MGGWAVNELTSEQSSGTGVADRLMGMLMSWRRWEWASVIGLPKAQPVGGRTGMRIGGWAGWRTGGRRRAGVWAADPLAGIGRAGGAS